MSHDVFICHSSKDRTVANAICAKLEANQIRCWIAPRDVVPGMDYAQSIVEAISAAKLTVLVFSDGSNHSVHVRREIERTASHGITILPFRLEEVTPSPSLEYFISDAHWLDALPPPPLERHLDHLVGTVRLLLDRETAALETTSAPAAPTPAQTTAPTLQPSKRRRPPVWALGLIALTALLVMAGGGWLIASRPGSSPTPTPPPQGSVVAESSETPTTPPPWTGFEWQHNPATGHYYALTDTGYSWDDLEALAVQTGGHLVAISDAAENRWLNSTFGRTAAEYEGAPGSKDHFLQIGLAKDQSSGKWGWTTGEPATYLPWCAGPEGPADVDENGNQVNGALGYYVWPGTPCWDALSSSIPNDYLGVIEVEAPPQ